jgi:hypothetical protein
LSQQKGSDDMKKLFAAALLGISLLASPTVYAGEKTITLAVPGMDCAACPVIVKSSLEGGAASGPGGQLLVAQPS